MMGVTVDIRHEAAAWPRPPSILRCLAALGAIKLVLRVVGLRRTLRAIQRIAPPAAATVEVSRELVDKIGRRVSVAAAFFPARAACLEQSLVLYWMLLRVRIPAAFRMGALPSNFAAHAWVEYRGEPVLESELVRTLIPFPRLPL